LKFQRGVLDLDFREFSSGEGVIDVKKKFNRGSLLGTVELQFYNNF
jgi:hypothetical protein